MKNQDISLLLLRITFGGLMIINHGFPKLQRFFGGEPIEFMEFMGLSPEISLGLAVFAEFLCAALIVLGLGTRYAAIPLIITMFVAAFVAHGDDPFRRKEGALLFMVPFIILLLSGGGKYALDALIGRQRA